MRHMVNNEKGLTLVELLATLVILVFVGLIAYSVLFTGFRTYDRVKVETELRDEADLIMSQLIGELFVLKESQIESKVFGPNDYYFIVEDDLGDKKDYGFKNGKLVVAGEENTSVLNSGLVTLDQSNTKIEQVKTGQYRIVLSLKSTQNDQSLTTISEISTIRDNTGE